MTRIAHKEWCKKNPWRRSYDCAKQRCSPNGKYFKNGIKMLMSLEDFKYLWFRDKAYNMVHPSIDRIDGKGDYTLLNCRFIEMDLNRNPKAVIGVKVFKSVREAAREVGGKVQAISVVANKKIQNNGKGGHKRTVTCKGYYWFWLKDYPNLALTIHSAQEKKAGK